MATRGFPASRVVSQDPVSGEIDATRFRTGVRLLATRIAAMTRPDETVGLMLPNANATAIAFMAVQSAGRVAAMMNFTAGAFNLVAAAKMTQYPDRAVVARLRREGQVRGSGSPRSKPMCASSGSKDLRDGAGVFAKLAAYLLRGRSGPISEAPGETWGAVDAALQKGSRGLPGGSSLALLLADKRGAEHLEPAELDR